MDTAMHAQQTETSKKLEYIQRCCVDLCNNTITLFEKSIKHSKKEEARIKNTTKEAVAELIKKTAWRWKFKNAFRKLIHIFAISSGDIDPAFVKSDSYDEYIAQQSELFLRTEAGQAILDLEALNLKALYVYINHFQRIIDSAQELKEKIKSSETYTLLCFRGLLNAYYKPFRPEEDLLMMHNAMTECGVIPQYSIKETIEERNTKLLKVRSYIERYLLPFENDDDIQQALSNLQ